VKTAWRALLTKPWAKQNFDLILQFFTAVLLLWLMVGTEAGWIRHDPSKPFPPLTLVGGIGAGSVFVIASVVGVWMKKWWGYYSQVLIYSSIVLLLLGNYFQRRHSTEALSLFKEFEFWILLLADIGAIRRLIRSGQLARRDSDPRALSAEA
jgi:hypothetical protein